MEIDSMEQVVYTQKWQDYFKKYGLCGFADLFYSFEGTQINKNNKRNVLVRSFKDNSREHTFFMKRFFNPHFKDMLFAIYNWRRPCSQAQLEWNCAHYLLQHGVNTYQPVCCGYKTFCGFEICSFFMTEKLSGLCLTDFFKQHWHALDLTQRNKILSDLAAFIRKIHGAGASLPDLYVYHLFIDRLADSTYSFAVIDLHRMSIRVPAWWMTRCRIENLARLNFTLRDEYIDMQLRKAFLRECLQDFSETQTDKMIKKIFTRSAKIAKRRKQPVY